MIDTIRARRLVVGAAKHSKAAEAWLLTDREGLWAARALQLLEDTKDRATELGMSADQVDAEISTYLAYLAVSALYREQAGS